MVEFELQYKNKFRINTAPDTEPGVLALLAAGITSVEPSTNDEVDQTPYYDGEGYTTSTVTGGQLILSISGHRVEGDPAQDFIFSNMLKFGKNRETDFEWERPNGEVISGDVTIANIEPGSGDANAKSEISFEIHFNGAPVVTPAV
ncbi:phage tail tube protein [Paenisporosarcina sp. TG-14]|uniref:phage tail tube protein n=1 Tax=Paenisporosarcina sp. TG-14 TaxID=1231057 RepID=UPI000364BF6B|nr:phage capsid protein [Paenisporosarcina sp. TG-14]